ncbi:MAG: tRNA pseudouridine(55) synthase TruB [Clostridiales bacterium]|jgi:tRNA pseudouridine55 synthase|nr:tRNA pseudouridine(55) synthase TruB [Clostridiales bacterium]
MSSGIYNINKPSGWTSFDVIAKVRNLLGTKKVGHAGTLDPMATGVLIVCVGNATKAVEELTGHDKQYKATFRLGISTDTQDITGNIINVKPSIHVTIDDVKKVIASFIGKISQVPPMFSAISVNGQRLYNLARKGIEVERTPREITIYNASILDCAEVNMFSGIDTPTNYSDFVNAKTLQITMLIDCSKGTYIRTLCNDIGECVGCGAVLMALERTKSGDFDINDSRTLNDLGEPLPADSAFSHIDKLTIDYDIATKLKNGCSVAIDSIKSIDLKNFDIEDDNRFRLYCNDTKMNKFLGIGRVISGQLKIIKNF